MLRKGKRVSVKLNDDFPRKLNAVALFQNERLLPT